MGYSNLRKGRYSAANNHYVVTTVTAAREPWFASTSACRAMREALALSEEKECFSAFAWVLMPDHLHLMLALGSSTDLSTAVERVKADSARRINAAIGRTGAIWQSGFYDHRLRSDDDLRAQARYLVANPLRAGLVQRIADYPHWFALWAPAPFGPAMHGDLVERLLEE